MPQWNIHDLRRSWRSLAARAGVPDIHAEAVLGHVQPGIQRIYNRHTFFKEKSAALATVAALIDTILRDDGKVVPMSAGKRSRKQNAG
jgi:integrase